MTAAGNPNEPDAYGRLGRALWEGDEHLRTFLELSPIGLVLMALDGRMLRVNAAICELFGRSAEELVTLTCFDIIDESERPGSRANVEGLREEDRPLSQVERRFLRPDGEEAWGLVNTVVVRDSEGAPIGLFSQIQDITQRKLVEAELRASEERFRTLFAHASVGQCLIDIEGRVVTAVNPALARLLGRGDEEMLGHPWEAFIHPEDRARTKKQIRALTDGEIPCCESAQRYLHHDGQWVETYTTVALVRDRDGRPQSFHILVQDETSRFEAEQRRRETEATLAFQATHDTLTSLPNRALFGERLRTAIDRLGRGTHRPLAVLFVDLDRFKYINDSMGHGAGDLVLFETAARLSQVIRPSDTLARFGGDEFTILCEDVDGMERATGIADRIIEAIRQPMLIDGHETYVGASVGIAMAHDGSATPEGLLSDADAAMYRAKEAGRGRYDVFDEHLRSATVRRVEIENGLRRALENEELLLHYQPIVDLDTSCLIGVEALLRWQRAEGPLYSPAEFIPVAEETGLINEIGEQVLFEACRQMSAWRARMDPGRVFHVTVNISPLQLLRPGFSECVEEVLRETELPAEWLALEITEGALMTDADAAIAVLERIRDLGVRIGIDDFGTGYSSLSYLQRFPVDLVKIDRSFTIALDQHNSQANALVGAVVHLGAALGINIVAEGVETADQARILASLGCEAVQGFLYSRPRPVAEITDLVLDGVVRDVAPVPTAPLRVGSVRGTRARTSFGDVRRSRDGRRTGAGVLRVVNE